MLLEMLNTKLTNDLTFSASDVMEVGMLSNTVGEARSVRVDKIALIYKRVGACGVKSFIIIHYIIASSM